MPSEKCIWYYSVVIVSFVGCLYLIAVTDMLPARYLSSNYHEVISPDYSAVSVVNDTKIILLWDSMWGYRFGVGKQPFLDSGCPVTNCFITKDPHYMPDMNFHAFVVHVPTNKTPWIHPNRRPDQIFVLFSTEPPQHMPKLSRFDNYFNWTMTYRSDSDIHLPYGSIEPLPWAPRTDTERLEMMAHVAGNTNPAAGKTKLAAWFVSNCNALSNRQLYVRQLQKYIEVDIFSRNGKCGGRDECPRHKNSMECYDRVEKTYKFYLSFENAICKEYVTEKFYDMMGRNIVPVVLGGANYSVIAPPHSYINALDYKPKELAEYLTKLDANDTLYAEYFWWKPYYRVRNLMETNRRAFCDLCTALHDVPSRGKVATGLQDWYKKQSSCVVRPTF